MVFKVVPTHSVQIVKEIIEDWINETLVYNTIQYNTIQYNTIQYNTIQYNTIQYNTIQYNTIKHYCPGPGNSFCRVSHKNKKYMSREIKIQINSLLKQYGNINHNKIQD